MPMKMLSFSIVAALSLSACKKEESTADAGAAKLSIDMSKLPPLPAFAAADVDSNASACTDLNQYVNGKWLATNPVPSDKTSWGSFEMLGEYSQAVQKQIVEAAAASKSKTGSVEQKIGDIYALGNNVEKLNADGVAPAKPLLAEIDAISDSASLAAYLRSSFAKGNQSVFAFGPGEDFKDAKNVIAYAFESGLSLPEKAYYLEDTYKPKRDAFVAHVERMMVMAGSDAATAKTQAQTVLAFETRLAKASLSPIEMRNPANQYNFVSLADADKATPNFNWTEFFKAQGLGSVKGFSLSQPKFFAEMNSMIAETPVADWKAYLSYQTLNGASGFLSDAVSDESFAFYGTTMRGQKEQRPRWKRVLSTINGTMGEALGQIYVEQMFPESSKVQMQALVKNLSLALKARLEKLEWMSAETKEKASLNGLLEQELELAGH